MTQPPPRWRSCSRTPPKSCAGRPSPTPPGSRAAPRPTAASPSSATACSASRSRPSSSGSLPDADIGELTKILNQAVSGRACADGRPRARAARAARASRRPQEGDGVPVETLLASERTLASVCEAVIGACYLAHGFERDRARPWSRRSRGEIELGARASASTSSPSCRSGSRATATTVSYEVADEAGPPHDRRFEVRARVGRRRGRRRAPGRSKKEAEQAAARAGAGEAAAASGNASELGREPSDGPCALPTPMYLKAINLKGFKSFPDRTRLTLLAGRQRDRRARTAAASRTSPTPSSGRSASRARPRSAASRCAT